MDQVNQQFLENHPEGVSTSTNADGMLPSAEGTPRPDASPILHAGSEVSLTLRVNPWTQAAISHLAVAAGPIVLGS